MLLPPQQTLHLSNPTTTVLIIITISVPLSLPLEVRVYNLQQRLSIKLSSWVAATSVTSNPVHNSNIAYDHHHSAPNIHENMTPPSHPPPPSPKCPRHGNNEQKFLEKTMAGLGRSPNKPKMKDTKEIMKKRRERAICVVTFNDIKRFSIFHHLGPNISNCVPLNLCVT